MDYVPTLSRQQLARCRRCEWLYATDDTEFPCRIIFELAYQVCHGELQLRAIQPQCIVTTDSQGNSLFSHDFSDSERPRIWQWFYARWQSQHERLLQSMQADIERDRQSRVEAAEATFQEFTVQKAAAVA